MKKEKMKPVAFVLTLALVVTCGLPYGVVYAASTSSGAATIDTTAQAKVELSDISGHWGEGCIKDAVSAGFVKGYKDGSFKPNRSVTRVEFVSMVNKALGLKDENILNLGYSDVKETDWYYKDIQKASYAGYIRGVSKTSFMPNKNITRQEAAVMMARILPDDENWTDATLSGYPDKVKISSWAKTAMTMVVGKGYLKGYSSGNLEPSGTLTRAEAAKIIGMILKKETIIKEDVSLKNQNETFQDKICVGNITLEKSIGDGDVALKNLTALGKVYVLGGGANTVTIKNSTIIQLIICKEGTKVRVLIEGETSIREAFVFNDNLLENSQEQSVGAGKGNYCNVIRLTGAVSVETAIDMANEISKRFDNAGKITQEQVTEAVNIVVKGAAVNVDNSGNFIVTLAGTNKKSGSSSQVKIGHCPCGVSLANEGAFTEIVEFNPTSPEGITVTGYAIYTEAQLQHLAMHLNSNAILMNDLDFTKYSSGSGQSTPMGALKAASTAGVYTSGHAISNFETGKFVPIGSSAVSPYTGIFYGNGKTITGLVVSGSAVNYTGLFGYTSGAAISDLTLSGGLIQGNSYVGSIVGYLGGGTISAISNMGTVTGINNVGGMVGMNPAGGTIEACDNAGTVNATGNYAGGVVGKNYGTFRDNHNTGEVRSTGSHVGGVIGYNNGVTISAISNTGAVTGADYVGGVFGDIEAGTLTNSENTGLVTGVNHVGGVAGINLAGGRIEACDNVGTVNATGNYVGGVTGLNSSSATVNACHNTAMVGGKGFVGGVTGYNWGIVDDSYNTERVNATDQYTGGVVGFNDAHGRVQNSHNLGEVNSTGSDTGGVAGCNISSAIVENNYNTGKITGTGYIGGVVGDNNGAVNSNYNSGAVNSTYYCSGGVVGNNSGTVNSSYNTGRIYSSGERTGGLAGQNENGATIQSCYNTGLVYSTNKDTGGIVGYNNEAVSGCYNTGEVNSADDNTGGIVGSNYKNVNSSFNAGPIHSTGCYTGGVAGQNSDQANVQNSYNIGPVSGQVVIGGIAGGNYSIIRNSYNTGAVNAAGNNTAGVAGLNNNGTTVQSCYNTGTIKSTGNYNGGAFGYNSGAVENTYWLEGTYAEGVGYGATGGVLPFTVSALPGMYASIKAITVGASGSTISAVNEVSCAGGDVTPNIFNALQGSYITTSSSLTITVDATQDATITVMTGSSLETLITPGGIVIDPTGSNEYTLSDLANNTWVLIKVVDEENPASNRIYTIYKP